MRKNFLFLICLCLLGILCVMPTKAVTPDAYTIIANPAEDASIEMNISWHTDLQYTNSYVEYTKKTDTEWTSSKKVFGTYEKNSVFDGNYSVKADRTNFYEDAVFLNYSATLTNLDPDTEYMYKVGQNTMSDVHYFKTAGDDEFSFAWISDYHAYTPLPQRLQSSIKMVDTIIDYNDGVDFVFSTGDDVAWGGSYSFWKDVYEKDPHRTQYMYAAVNGNHDNMDRTGTKNSNQYFRTVNNYPKNGYQGEEGVCYYFIYSNVLFIIFNTEDLSSSEEVEKAKAWFEEVVQNNPTQYIIVAQHYQWFSGSTGSSNSSGYTRWKDLFDQYGVDLAIAGNNHIYLRTNSIYQGNVSNDPNHGTVYIDAPSSDNERGNTMNDTLSYNQEWIASRWTEGGPSIGGMAVNVNTDHISVELLNRYGELIDSTIIPSRREAHPLGNFNKTEFENSFQFIPGTIPTSGVLTCSSSGRRMMQKIEVWKDNQLLLSTNLRKTQDTNMILNGLDASSKNVLTLRITYCDGSVSNKSFVCKTGQLQGSLNCFKADIQNGKYLLSWNNTYSEGVVTQYRIYKNHTFLMDVDGSKVEVNLSDSNVSLLDEFTIEAYQDEFLLWRSNTNYFDYTDVDLDGNCTIEDIQYLQETIVHKIQMNEEYQVLYDFNQDGQLNIADVNYLYLFLEKKISSLTAPTFKVQFLDMYGNLIQEENVKALEDATPPDVQLDGYVFLGWNMDYHHVTKDMVIKGIFYKEPSVIRSLYQIILKKEA